MGVDLSKGFGQLVDESVALWSKMVFEEARQKHQIVMNAKDIQQEGLEVVDTLQGKLEMLLESMQVSPPCVCACASARVSSAQYASPVRAEKTARTGAVKQAKSQTMCMIYCFLHD